LDHDVSPLIRAVGLRKRYGVHFVLDGVSIDVQAGESLALLGANGAGKTTLLRTIATLSRPSAGAVAVAGHDSVREAEVVRRQIGYVGHGSHLYEDLTAAENIRFWAALAGTSVDGEAALNALAAVELEAVAGDRVRTFSAGMKRRLSLARLLLARPRVLLLDEPFAGLDQRAAKWLEEHLLARKVDGAAIVMSTHSFGRALGVADRVAILAEGRVAVDVRREGLGGDELQRLYALHVEGQA
jgi:heme ABC exporter ATP-binding subunit CcmA